MEGMVAKLVKRRFERRQPKRRWRSSGFLRNRSAGAFPLDSKGRESLWTSGHSSERESWGR